MESTEFLSRPQKSISIVSWNINSVRSKLEKNNVLKILNDYDIVSLNEIKTSLQVSLPGYVAFCSRNSRAPGRGGTVVFVKEYLKSRVMEVDLGTPDQVWLTLSCALGVLFGFVYVPPRDSPYYSDAAFSHIQEKIKGNPDKDALLIGDVNARFGEYIQSLAPFINSPDETITYPDIPDKIPTPNQHASVLFGICCEENMLLLNNLKYGESHFKGNLTCMEIRSRSLLCSQKSNQVYRKVSSYPRSGITI